MTTVTVPNLIPSTSFEIISRGALYVFLSSFVLSAITPPPFYIFRAMVKLVLFNPIFHIGFNDFNGIYYSVVFYGNQCIIFRYYMKKFGYSFLFDENIWSFQIQGKNIYFFID
jgi:hypothetical protein